MTRAASVFPAPGGPASNRGLEGIALQYCCMIFALSGSAITRSWNVFVAVRTLVDVAVRTLVDIESSTLVDRLGLINNQRRYHHGQKGAERHFT